VAVNVNIQSLTAEERLALIGDIWDSLTLDDLPLSDAQRDELDRRLDESADDTAAGIPWEDVLQQIRARRR
jgi:putative addiction module component (TIGR02574 family)